MKITTPLILTSIRLICSPLILPFCIVYGSYLNLHSIMVFVAILFLLLSFTDYLDGFFARKYAQTSVIGALLDPIADKFLSYAVLIALVAAEKIYFYWAILLIGRELYILSIRQIAADYSYRLPVSLLGKCKTFFLTAYVTVALLYPTTDWIVPQIWWFGIYTSLLFATIALSLISAAQYSKEFFLVISPKVEQ